MTGMNEELKELKSKLSQFQEKLKEIRGYL